MPSPLQAMLIAAFVSLAIWLLKCVLRAEEKHRAYHDDDDDWWHIK